MCHMRRRICVSYKGEDTFQKICLPRILPGRTITHHPHILPRPSLRTIHSQIYKSTPAPRPLPRTAIPRHKFSKVSI